jgi:hypothetical protein
MRLSGAASVLTDGAGEWTARSRKIFPSICTGLYQIFCSFNPASEANNGALMPCEKGGALRGLSTIECLIG